MVTVHLCVAWERHHFPQFKELAAQTLFEEARLTHPAPLDLEMPP
jgi:hypothetical protein